MNSKLIVGSVLEDIVIDEFMKLRAYEDGQDGSGFSFDICILDGLHSKRTNRRSVKAYYVLSGSASIVIDNVSHVLVTGDYVSAPPSSNVEIVGNKCQMVLVCCPEYRDEDEQIY